MGQDVYTSQNAKKWFWVAMPLVLHFLSAITLAGILLMYIDHHNFYLQSRRPNVIQADGSSTRSSNYGLLQSDITTLVSAGGDIVNGLLAWWLDATAFRWVFISMENWGVTARQIDAMAQPKPWKFRGIWNRKSRNINNALAYIIFGLSLSRFSAPILTGSITWSVSSQFSSGSSQLSGITKSFDGGLWPWYNNGYEITALMANAAGFIDIAWQGSRQDTAVMKRVIRNAEHLTINSTLSNITVPYFSVRSLEWISDPIKELTDAQLNFWRNGSSSNPFHESVKTSFALLPDTAWALPPRPSYPDEIMVSETRLLVGLFDRGNTIVPCGIWGPYGALPPYIGYLDRPSGPDRDCYIYAHVTYDAGTAICEQCRISSSMTVQNDTALTLLPDSMTADALALMPMISAQIVSMNTSLPTAWNNLDQFVSELLSRSYGGAWTAVTENTSDGPLLSTNVSIQIPASKANVLSWRVFLWLGVNMVVTISGIVFIIIQRRCKKPVAEDPFMVALLLDTHEISQTDEGVPLEKDVPLTLQYDNHWHVVTGAN